MRPAHRLAACVLLLLAVAAAYLPALRAGFVYDDHRLLAGNPFLRDSLDWRALFFDPNAAVPEAEADIYRPLAFLSLYVERALSGGNPSLHHAVGIILHAINACLVLALLLRLLELRDDEPPSRNRSVWPAFFGAGLFALHPVQVESVAWISSRAGQLAALFTLLALLGALRSGRTGGDRTLRAAVSIAAAALFTALACLSKESGAITGALILVLWICVPKLRSRSVLVSAAAALGAAGVYVILRQTVMHGALDQVAPHGGDRWTGFLYGGYGSLYEIGLIFRPWFQNVDYQDGFFDRVPFAAVAAGAAVYFFVVAAGAAMIRRFPLAAAGILFFAAAQLPTSSLIVTLRSLVNERYLYVPLIGVAVLGAALAARVRRLEAGRAAAAAAGCAVLLVLGAFTALRCLDWKDDRSIWEATLETHPGSIRARVGLAKEFLAEGDAKRALQIAVEGNRIGRYGTAVKMNACYKAVQALAALQRFEQAERLLEQLLAEVEDPASEEFSVHRSAWVDLWTLKAINGRFDGAAEVARIILRRYGDTAAHLDLLGISLLDAGRIEEAEEVLLQAAGRPDTSADIHEHLAELYARTGRAELAERERATARRLAESSGGRAGIDADGEAVSIPRTPDSIKPKD